MTERLGRPYRGWDDLAAMRALCSARLVATPGRAVVHPGDIAWWVGWPPHTVEELAGLFLLWEESGDLAGFAAFQPEDGDMSVFVMPERTDTAEAVAFEEEALAWATRPGVPLRWAEFDDETAAVERWRRRGFRPTDDALLNLVRTLDDVGWPTDEQVREVQDDDVRDRASITHGAFGSKLPFEQYAAQYAAFRSSPAYAHVWDLMVRDAQGRPGACCLAWFDETSRAGTFEPVGTHPDGRRQGFARAALLDGLRRFAEAGMDWVIIGVDVDNPGAEALYRGVGFVPDRTLRWYTRD